MESTDGRYDSSKEMAQHLPVASISSRNFRLFPATRTLDYNIKLSRTHYDQLCQRTLLSLYKKFCFFRG